MHSFKQKYLVNFWDNYKALVTLGILSAVYFGIFGSVWAVTGEMTRWGGEFLELFGVDLSSYSYYQKQNLSGTPLTRTDGLMLIGMFVGCFIAALWANKVKWRLPASKIRIFQALVGGALAGFGARLAFGCNLANFFTGLPYFSLHTWIFTLFMVGGIYVGVKLCNMPFFKPKAKLMKVDKANCILKPDKTRARVHFALGSVLFILFVLTLGYLSAGELNVKDKSSLLSLALLFGFGFGFVIARAQICFTSCFRDLFLFGRDKAVKGALMGMIIASLIAFAFILQGHGTKLIEISPALVFGAFLFGFGIVFAGGCECGWTYRAFEGQTHFMLVGVANIAGTMIVALSYDLIPSALKDGVKINLLSLGNLTGFGLNFTLFIFVFVLILWYKKNFFKGI